jgi:hypothetical protein
MRLCSTCRDIGRHLRLVAQQRAEEFLAEIPRPLRKLRTLRLVLSIAIPGFLFALIAALRHLAS